MTNRALQTSAQKAVARKPVVARRAVQTPGFSRLLADLKSLAELGGAVLADSYARAASSFLEGLEELEDRNAERRYRQHAVAPRASEATKRAVVPRASQKA